MIARAIGYNWVLSFSTEEHGFSLNTLYRKLSDTDGPCLIVVKDTHNNVIFDCCFFFKNENVNLFIPNSNLDIWIDEFNEIVSIRTFLWKW